MKALTSLVSLLALVGGQPYTEEADAGPRDVIRLSKTNVIRGKRTGYTRVYLPTRAVLDVGVFVEIRGDYPRFYRKQGPSPSLEVKGEGKFIGLAMTPDRDNAAPLFVSGQFRRPTKSNGVVNFSSPFYKTHVRLSPGTYRVYLIADGHPAEVRFTFDKGFSDVTRLKPSTGTNSDVHTTDEFTELGEAGAKYSVHEHVVESRRALASFVLLLVQGGEEVVEGMGVCIHNLDGPAPVSYFGPRCGNGFDKIFVAEAQGRSDTFLMVLDDHGVTEGRWGLGGWYAGDARPKSVSHHSLTVG